MAEGVRMTEHAAHHPASSAPAAHQAAASRLHEDWESMPLLTSRADERLSPEKQRTARKTNQEEAGSRTSTRRSNHEAQSPSNSRIHHHESGLVHPARQRPAHQVQQASGTRTSTHSQQEYHSNQRQRSLDQSANIPSTLGVSIGRILGSGTHRTWGKISEFLVYLCILWAISSFPVVSGQAACDNQQHDFRANYVTSTCSLVGAIPHRQTHTLMQYDFRAVPKVGEKISLVRSPGGDTYADCSDTSVVNPVSASASASGHMEPVPVAANTTDQLATVQQSYVVAALAAMEKETYEVCFYDGSTWKQKGIRTTIQDVLSGLSVDDTKNANGIRTAVPRNQGTSPEIRFHLMAGVTPSSGDQVVLVPLDVECSTTAFAGVVQEFYSGILQADILTLQGGMDGASAALQDTANVVAMAPGHYQVCFQKEGGSFIRTGASVSVQQDLLTVTVNGVSPALGLRPIFPRATGSSMSATREELPLGYKQTVLETPGGPTPIAFYAFEDLEISEAMDTHCESCSTFDGVVVNPTDRSNQNPAGGVGTAKYIQFDLSAHVRLPSTLLTSGKAFTIAFFFRPALCTEADTSLCFDQNPFMSILSPSYSLGNFAPGSVEIRFDNFQGFSPPRRRLSLNVKEYFFQFVNFDHQFTEGTWAHVTLSMDMAAQDVNQRDIVDLYVDGIQTESQQVTLESTLPATGIQFSPATVGAWDSDGDGSAVAQYLLEADMDELAFYDVKVPTSTIVNQLLAKNIENSVLILSGSFVVLPIDGDCHQTLDFHVSRKITWSSGFDTRSLMEIVGTTDSVNSLTPGLYQLCYTRLDGETLSSGIPIDLQEDLTALIVNRVRSARGLRSAIPQAGHNLIQTERLNSLPQGDFISLIPPTRQCEISGDNPDVCDASTSGYMMVNGTEGTALRGTLCPSLDIGTYQVCYKSATSGQFQGTGVSLTIQPYLSSLGFNGLEAGRGHRAAVPFAKVSTARFTSSVTDIEFLNISVIPSVLDCSSAAENPPRAASNVTIPDSNRSMPVSGYLSTQPVIGQAGQFSLQGVWPSPLLALPIGQYQLCVGTRATGGVLHASGIGVEIQDKVDGLSVNYLSANDGVRVDVPRLTGNLVQLSGTFKWSANLSIALIERSEDCDQIEDTPACATPLCVPAGAAAKFRVDSQGKIARDDALPFASLNAEPNGYQVCLREEEMADWVGTGIGVKVQDEFYRLFTNSLSSSQGLRSALPRVSGNKLEYEVKVPDGYNFLSLVEGHLDCGEQGLGKPMLLPVLPSLGGVLGRVNLVMKETLDFALGNTSDATYQVCFAPNGGTNIIGTGISLRLQSEVTGLTVNSVSFLPSFPSEPDGIVATAPRRTGSSLLIQGRQLMGAEIGEGRALAAVSMNADCAYASDNPVQTDAARNASGLMTVFAFDASANNTESFSALEEGSYQICHRLLDNSSFLPTGISIMIQGSVVGAWGGSEYAIHDGLHTALSEKDGKSLVLNGTLPDGSTSSFASGSVAFVLASGLGDQCRDININSSLPTVQPVFPADGLSGSEFDAAWGANGSEARGLYHLCIQKAAGTQFRSTGVAVHFKSAPSSGVDFRALLVNRAIFWTGSVAPMPKVSQGMKVSYESRGACPNATFYLWRDCTEGQGWDFFQDVEQSQGVTVFMRSNGCELDTSGLDRILESDINDFLFADSTAQLCYSPTGQKEHRVYTGVLLRLQGAATGLELNEGIMNSGLFTSIPKFSGHRLVVRSSTPADLAEVESVSFISLMGDCDNPAHNPAAPTSGASGHMRVSTVDGTPGRVDIDTAADKLGSYQLQVCYKVSSSSEFAASGVVVEIAAKLVVEAAVDSASSLSPSRCDVTLAKITVSLKTNQGVQVQAFDSTFIRATLFRCQSPCGDLVSGFTGCSQACSSWQDVTGSLTGGNVSLTSGAAVFDDLLVVSNAGRFYISFLWLRDGKSTSATDEFVVLPHHLITSGINQGEVFPVGLQYGPTTDKCEYSLLPREDVRCRGAAALADIVISFVDAADRTLDMLVEHDSFQVEARLEQGTQGILDSGHSLVPDASDFYQMEALGVGGNYINTSNTVVVDAGVARFAGSKGLMVRRQAGLFFRVDLKVIGSTQSFLSVKSSSFAISPAALVIDSFDSSGASTYQKSVTDLAQLAILGEYVELPSFGVRLTDQGGHTLSHMQCSDCISVDLQTLTDDLCSNLGIAEPLGCSTLDWESVTGSICRNVPAGTVQPSSVKYATREQCEVECIMDIECVGINYYPPAKVDEFLLQSTCWIVHGACTQQTSTNGGSLYLKPDDVNAVDPECLCPVQNFDGREIRHVMHSSQIISGTDHVVGSDISQGRAQFNGMFVKYVEGLTMQLSLKQRGLNLTQSSEALILVQNPEPQSYDPHEYEPASCACSFKSGLTMITLDENDVMQGVVDPPPVATLPQYDTAAMFEMGALNCLCTALCQGPGTCL